MILLIALVSTVCFVVVLAYVRSTTTIDEIDALELSQRELLRRAFRAMKP
jgi:hypothetical protein